MPFIHLWNTARCDVAKWGFQLRTAEGLWAVPTRWFLSHHCQGHLGGDRERQRPSFCQPSYSLPLQLFCSSEASHLSTYSVNKHLLTAYYRPGTGWEPGKTVITKPDMRPAPWLCVAGVAVKTSIKPDSNTTKTLHCKLHCVSSLPQVWPEYQWTSTGCPWECPPAWWAHAWRFANGLKEEELQEPIQGVSVLPWKSRGQPNTKNRENQKNREN